MKPAQTRIIAHHLIMSGYGFWAANDLRGSGSETIRQAKFEDLAPIHHGRKTLQPTREQLREFHRKVTPLLEHPPLWFNEATRLHIGKSLGELIAHRRYTVWACSVGSNHVHLCVRVHRDTYQQMWKAMAEATRIALVKAHIVDNSHPVWADRPYSVYLHLPDDIRRVNRYIEANPEKEGLPPQHWDFVQKYDGWPLARR